MSQHLTGPSRGTVIAIFAGLLCLPVAIVQAAEPTPLTILLTNDLHSHLRGEKTPLGLGGVARIKTAVDRVRASSPNTLFVDGGDWSEGNIYYTEGAGSEVLKMLDHLTYDAAVVGNHDWYNGVDVLLDVLKATSPKVKLLATNVSTAGYPREGEFRRLILPYTILEVGGIKVAFMGLLTYEFIYDSFFDPIKIKEPFAIARELSTQLKKQADVVIAISHNSIKLNQGILKAAPEVDFIVGGHDHAKLTKPIIVERRGAKPGWIVEANDWGRYLGRVDLKVTPAPRAQSKATVELVNYALEQMDSSIPEDPETLRRIAVLEARIEGKRGPILHDHVADSEVELARHGQEHLMGNFATDAYRAASGADLALDQSALIYGEIHEGAVDTVDLFNSNPGIFNPVTEKAWTLHTLPVQGKALSRLLNILYSAKALSQRGLSFSGAEIVYTPLMLKSREQSSVAFGEPDVFAGVRGEPGQDPTANGISIESFKIQGQPLEPNRTYILAAPGGVVLSLQFLKRLLPGAIPLTLLKDTGMEDWRIMADYLAAHNPLTSDAIPYGRVRTAAADLGMLHNDVSWEPKALDDKGRMLARVRAVVTNQGLKTSSAGTANSGPRISLLINRHGVNYALDMAFQEAAPTQALPQLATGESIELVWDNVAIPASLGLYPITVQVRGIESEPNHSNDEVTREFAHGPTLALSARRSP